MKELFEKIRGGCPWLVIRDNEDPRRYECKVTKDNCWYRGCAVLYWIKQSNNQINPNDNI